MIIQAKSRLINYPRVYQKKYSLLPQGAKGNQSWELVKGRVKDGSRTHDLRNHNPSL